MSRCTSRNRELRPLCPSQILLQESDVTVARIEFQYPQITQKQNVSETRALGSSANASDDRELAPPSSPSATSTLSRPCNPASALRRDRPPSQHRLYPPVPIARPRERPVFRLSATSTPRKRTASCSRFVFRTFEHDSVIRRGSERSFAAARADTSGLARAGVPVLSRLSTALPPSSAKLGVLCPSSSVVSRVLPSNCCERRIRTRSRPASASAGAERAQAHEPLGAPSAIPASDSDDSFLVVIADPTRTWR